MKNTGFVAFTFCLAFCEVLSFSIKTHSVRKKRWDNSKDMSTMFRGTAGVDYPDFKSIPTTNFRCENQVYEGGLYADVETQCQVYHICHDGRKDSFLCGKGTVFNQQILACDYWYSTECDNAPSFYHLNAQIGNSYLPQNPPSGFDQNHSGFPQNPPSGFDQNPPSGFPQYPASGFSQNPPSVFPQNPPGISTYDDIPPHSDGASNNPAAHDRRDFPSRGENGGSDNSHSKQQCKCFQSSFKTPWTFPSN